MTGPDSQETRPISVAELLARNGTIGAPPVGGRRRRRRGNTDAVTVAELTGEIPIVRDDEAAPEAPAETNGTVEPALADDVEAPPEAQVQDAEVADTEVPAEEMLPDPVDVETEAQPVAAATDAATEAEPVDVDDEDAERAVADDQLDEELDSPPSYLHAVREPLFGGQLEDDLRSDDVLYYDDEVTELPEVPAETTTAEDHEEAAPPTRMRQIGRGALIVLQSIFAVAFGAGLFIAFDELWKWNNIVALVLSVLVILGLVVGVRIVRKTEDIASTLIAVAVGALVTLGPLALLQSG